MILVNTEMPKIAYKDGSRSQLAAFAGAFMSQGAVVTRHIIVDEPGAKMEFIRLRRVLERVRESKYSWLPTALIYNGNMPFLSRKVPAFVVSADPAVFRNEQFSKKLREMPCPCSPEVFDKEGVAMLIEAIYEMGFVNAVEPWTFQTCVDKNFIRATIDNQEDQLGVSYQVSSYVTDPRQVGGPGSNVVTRSFVSWFDVTCPGYSIEEIAGVVLEPNDVEPKTASGEASIAINP